MIGMILGFGLSRHALECGKQDEMDGNKPEWVHGGFGWLVFGRTAVLE